MKTLDQIEPRTPISELPYTISQSGSYYFSGNLTAAGSDPGITIAADNVTVDLNGFALIGGGGGNVSGLLVPAVQRNLHIRNGTVRGWGANGISATNATNTRIEHVRAVQNGYQGVSVGANSMITHCLFAANGNDGLSAGEQSIVIRSVAANNGAKGIAAGNASTVRECVAQGNSGNGIDVFTNGLVERCASNENSFFNISALSNSIVRDSVANSSLSLSGIGIGAGAVVRNSVARLNRAHGIFAPANGGIISENLCLENNQAGSSTNAGIFVSGNALRIERNHSVSNGTGNGIRVSGVNNLIISNSASGHDGQIIIGSGNEHGTISDSPWINIPH